MISAAPLLPFAAIVVAAGKGLRVGGDTPKQFREWRGKPLIRHSVEALRDAGANPLVPKGELFGDGAVGHSGYTGTALLLVPEVDTVIALCTNAVYADKDAFLIHRRRIMNVIAGNLQ